MRAVAVVLAIWALLWGIHATRHVDSETGRPVGVAPASAR